MTESGDSQGLSFLDHLEELRWRLLKGIAAIALFAVPCGIFWERLFSLVMLHPLRFADPRPRLIITSPVEGFMLSVKIAIAGGVILAAPVLFYQLWRFVAPGLYKHEKAVIIPTVAASTLSFLAGIAFCYLLIPYVIRFLASFAGANIDALYRTNEYLSFIIRLTLAFGIVFELPVISYVLTRLGIITAASLVGIFKYALVAIFVLSALLTPPDILSQLMLALPLLALYGISILVSVLVQRKQG